MKIEKSQGAPLVGKGIVAFSPGRLLLRVDSGACSGDTDFYVSGIDSATNLRSGRRPTGAEIQDYLFVAYDGALTISN